VNNSRRLCSFSACSLAAVVTFGVIPVRAASPEVPSAEGAAASILRSEEGRDPGVLPAEAPLRALADRSDPVVLAALGAAGRVSGPSVSTGPGEVSPIPAADAVRTAATELVPAGDVTSTKPTITGSVSPSDQVIVLPPCQVPVPVLRSGSGTCFTPRWGLVRRR
jgi:hypothetical protein